MNIVFPPNLKMGDKFKIRKAVNSTRYIVAGIVLKICKENGLAHYPTEDHGKVLVPVTVGSRSDKLVLEPTKELYVL